MGQALAVARRPPRRLDRRLEGVAEAVGGGYCRLQMPLRLALGVRGTVVGRRLGALEGGVCPLFQCIPPPPGPGPPKVRCGPTTVLQPRLPSHGLHRQLSSSRVGLAGKCSIGPLGCSPGWGAGLVGPHGQGCIRRKGTPEAAAEAVRQAVGGGYQSGWGRLQMPLRMALGVRGTVAGRWRGEKG